MPPKSTSGRRGEQGFSSFPRCSLPRAQGSPGSPRGCRQLRQERGHQERGAAGTPPPVARPDGAPGGAAPSPPRQRPARSPADGERKKGGNFSALSISRYRGSFPRSSRGGLRVKSGRVNKTFPSFAQHSPLRGGGRGTQPPSGCSPPCRRCQPRGGGSAVSPLAPSRGAAAGGACGSRSRRQLRGAAPGAPTGAAPTHACPGRPRPSAARRSRTHFARTFPRAHTQLTLPRHTRSDRRGLQLAAPLPFPSHPLRHGQPRLRLLALRGRRGLRGGREPRHR